MGVFIYKTKGKFPDKFVMEAVDVFLMAKGVAAEVGYKTDAQFFSDLDEAGLLEDSKGNFYSRGLIHSHHNMGTSFSGTDFTELKKAAESNPYYLSVVVNNAMDFTAKVAIESKEILTGYSYYKTPNNKEIKKAKTTTANSFEIIDVEVECHWPDYMLQVDERIKVMQKYTVPVHNYHNNWGTNYHAGYKPQSSYGTVRTTVPVSTGRQLSAWDDDGWEDSYKTVTKPKETVVEAEEDLYEAYSQLLELIVENLKSTYKEPDNFVNALMISCTEADIPYEILKEYCYTADMVNEIFDDKVCELLETKLVLENGK